MINKKALIKAAFEGQKNAYTPYSHFNVGAALLTKSGKIYTGCNIESCTYTPTNCAERTALFKAVSEGNREFIAIAIVASLENAPPDDIVTSPCGVCRQVLYEFAKDDLIVIMAKTEDDFIEMNLGELLPLGFGSNKLKKEK